MRFLQRHTQSQQQIHRRKWCRHQYFCLHYFSRWFCCWLRVYLCKNFTNNSNEFIFRKELKQRKDTPGKDLLKVNSQLNKNTGVTSLKLETYVGILNRGLASSQTTLRKFLWHAYILKSGLSHKSRPLPKFDKKNTGTLTSISSPCIQQYFKMGSSLTII